MFVTFCELTTIKTGATLDRAVCEESVTLPRHRRSDERKVHQFKCICINRHVVIIILCHVTKWWEHDMGCYHMCCICTSTFIRTTDTLLQTEYNDLKTLVTRHVLSSTLPPNCVTICKNSQTYCCVWVYVLVVMSLQDHVCMSRQLLLSDDHREDDSEVISTPSIFPESNIS